MKTIYSYLAAGLIVFGCLIASPETADAQARRAPAQAQPKGQSASQSEAKISNGMVASGATGGTSLLWYGHAAFKLVTPKGRVILIDPWLRNPLNKDQAEADLKSLEKVDLILISHGHFDHIGDAVEIAKRTGAKLVSGADLGQSLVQNVGYPAEQAGYDTQGNIGGKMVLLDGEVTIQLTQAVHSSGVAGAEGKLQEGGTPTGFLIMIANGPTLYHTGDTGLFSDMALIGKERPVDVMLCCIGDHFVMGPEQAAEAVRLVGAKRVIPMHFGTFPVLYGTAEGFAKNLEAKQVATKMTALKVHEEIKL